MGKKEKVYDLCALCKTHAELEESHIIPKFFYRQAGLTKESFSIVCLSRAEATKHNNQDGPKEFLLCGVCEDRFEKWETYASKEIFGKGNQFEAITSEGILWNGLEYSKMKLLFISIIWRMSVSKHDLYARVDVGERHEAIMRKMLLANDPGESWLYGCMLGYLFVAGKPVQDGLFSQPHPFVTDGNRTVYRFLMCKFYVVIDVCLRRPSVKTTIGYLQLNGQWGVPSMEANEVPFINEEIIRYESNSHLYKQGKKRPA